MESKAARHEHLRKLVSTKKIRSQRALLTALEAADLGVDQSTLSRDLQELGIRKVAGRYQQVRIAEPALGGSSVAAQVTRYSTCGPNLVVIHTAVGQAQPVALFLDAAEEPGIEGTIAGDDTVFVAIHGRRQQSVVLRRLADWFGEEHHVR